QSVVAKCSDQSIVVKVYALAKFTTILGGRSFRRRGRGHRRSTSAASRAAHPVDLPPAGSTSGAAGSSTGATSAGSSSTSKLKYNPAEASDIQKSFRANQRRTLQSILSGPPQYRSIPPEQVEAHFRGVLAVSSGTRRSNFTGSLCPWRTTCCSPALTRRRSGTNSGGSKIRPPAPMGFNILP
ncbi:hypothetical protein NPIL_238591, partial [Nephila pilipes]